jgi:hypothetical protein
VQRDGPRRIKRSDLEFHEGPSSVGIHSDLDADCVKSTVTTHLPPPHLSEAKPPIQIPIRTLGRWQRKGG